MSHAKVIVNPTAGAGRTGKKWPQIRVYNTICNATSRRQSAIRELAPQVDMVLVVGSETSANSKRLVQISLPLCERSYLINSERDIDVTWFADEKVTTVALTAGASTPDFLVRAVIDKLVSLADQPVEVLRQQELPGNQAIEHGKKTID